jgi:hypothetical protein
MKELQPLVGRQVRFTIEGKEYVATMTQVTEAMASMTMASVTVSIPTDSVVGPA